MKEIENNRINLNQIEIEIFTGCNLHCFNCDRSVRQAPSNDSMSLDQIFNFIKESKELKWNWKRISILGGEPTLHPNFFEILDIFYQYKLDTSCEIEVITNGFGEVKKIISKIPDWVIVRNSNKIAPIQKFYSYNIATIDILDYKDLDFSKGCLITSRNGLGLTVNGYYPCGAGASVDRIFNKNIGIKELKNVNEESLREQMKFLCSICGHYKRNFDDNLIDNEQISKTWKLAYSEYKKKLI